MEVASGLDLAAADARVLHNSNKLALRLLPCDVVARVAFAGLEAFQAELEIGRRLAEIEVPVGSLEPRVEPRVYERHGFVVTFWTYYEQARQEVSPADYAKALERLHAGMAKVDVTVPHFLGPSRGSSTTRCEPGPNSRARRLGTEASQQHVTKPET